MKTSLLILATGLLLTAAPAAHAQVAPATATAYRYVEDEGQPVYPTDGPALVQAPISNPMGGAATFAGPIRFDGTAADPGYAVAPTRRLKPSSWSLAAVQARHGEDDGYRQDASRLLPAGEQVENRAQEVGSLSPELVSTGPDGSKAVNYAQLTPVLLEAMQQQQTQIESLLKLAVVFGQRAAEAEAASISRVSRAEAATARLAQRLRTLEAATAHARR